jgi:hypothetical protein
VQILPPPEGAQYNIAKRLIKTANHRVATLNRSQKTVYAGNFFWLYRGYCFATVSTQSSS